VEDSKGFRICPIKGGSQLFHDLCVKNNKTERRKTMKKIIFAVMMAAILVTSGLAMGQGWGKGPGMGMGYGPYYGGARAGGPGPWGALNLSPEQVEKMRVLRDSFFKEKIPLGNELMSKRLELRALWVQTNPDEEKILAKQKEINGLRAQLQEKATKSRLEMLRILSPEQRARWQAYKASFRHGRGNDRGCGWGRGPGRHRPCCGKMGEGMGYGRGW
jgi:Spy/CpxP family protein refolding chaperone